MVYVKPFNKIPQSRRSPTDLSPRALILNFQPNTQFYSPMGMKSKQRLRRLLTPTDSFLRINRNRDIEFLLTEQPRSIHETFLRPFLTLARRRNYHIFVNGINLTVKPSTLWLEEAL